MSSPPEPLPSWDQLPFWDPRPPVQAPPRRRRGWLIAAGVLILVGGGVAVAAACADEHQLADVPPARAVAGAYWTAVQHRNLAAMRRLLCDDDRVLLSAADDQTLSRSLFPTARAVLGHTVAGQQEQGGVTVVFVEVVRDDNGRVHTVTRPTPVVQQAGMYSVCFHSAGLSPGS
ncbi:MAG TPA: hypothetical protein VMU51_36225 [Mycobacteriales bacterium]|nr:hypothetical protein [Mycobacteriales bacterium]